MGRTIRLLLSMLLLVTLNTQQVLAAASYYTPTGQTSSAATTTNQGTVFYTTGGNISPQPGSVMPQPGSVMPQTGATPLNVRDRLLQNQQQVITPAMIQPALALRAEAGDGLVKLSWRLHNMATALDISQVQYTVYYGLEPGKPVFVQQVGLLDNTIIRELKNYQPYYISIVATDPQRGLMVRSDEQRVIPVPLAELGSRIEGNFARKTMTLHDSIKPTPLERQLKQFGYDFFANTAQLAAVDSLPDSGDYQVGPADTLQLKVWGGVEFQQELTVDRNGEVAIPKIGTVNVAGMTLDQARTAIKNSLAGYLRDFNMSLSLGRLRSTQVYLVGEVINPGRYAVSSFGTVINALAAAGGPSRNGSLRTIKVTRGSKQIAVVDLYDMLLRGDRSQDLRLQNGDTIFVPVIGPVVAVAGEVKRPAIYEIKGETSLEDVLTMAGGVSANGYMGRIQVERIKDNQSRIVLDYVVKGMDEAKLLSSTVMQDQDMVKVFPVEEAIRQVVTLKGNVVRPGEYQLRKGMRLSDIIPSTAALLPESYLDSVEISRLSPPDWRRELVTVNLRRALAGNEADNLLLQEQDSIRVFSRWEMEEKPKVAINGAVVTPGTYDFYPGMTVRDLVTAAGSPRRYAYLDQAELSRIIVGKEKAAWTRIPFDLGRAMAGDSSQNLALQQDDVLIVRTISEWHDATERLVTLKGEVRYPGVYTIARGEKLDAVIRRAGGYTDKAYLRGAKFTRASVRALQQQRMDEMLSRTEQQVMRKQAELASVAASKEELAATQAALEGLAKSLEKMRLLRAEGRVVVALTPLDELQDSAHNIEMEPGDQLEIPERPGTVTVIGQVYNQTSFISQPDENDVADYLAKAGGPTADGESSEMYIVRADGTVSSSQQYSFWRFGSFDATPLLPGDTLVVPQKLERVAWMREIKDITQILANIAVATGTIWIGLK